MPEQRNQNRQGSGRNGQLPQEVSYGHVMPQAPEIEKAVLGALISQKTPTSAPKRQRFLLSLHRDQRYKEYEMEKER